MDIDRKRSERRVCISVGRCCDWSEFGMSTDADRSNYCWNHRKKTAIIRTVGTVNEQEFPTAGCKRTNVCRVL